MCLGISTPDGGKTELIFVQEQILLNKNGSKNVRVDLLIQNTGRSDIKRLRIELPCRLMTDAELKGELKRVKNETQEESYTRLCREQCSKLRVDTTRLLNRDDPDNWIYKILPHFSLGEWDQKLGKLCCIRDEIEILTGWIKHDWKIAVSQEIGDDPWRWYACFVNGITVFDYVVSKEKEYLRPAEAMWISVEFTVPQKGMQHIYWPPFWRRMMARQWEFPLVLMSPKAFVAWRTNQLIIFGRKKQFDAHLQAAIGHVREILDQSNHSDVLDWRLFLHWSSRISIQRISVPTDIVEPPSDHTLVQAKTDWFSWFYLKKELNPDSACRDEFWFGENHEALEPSNGFRLEFKAHVNNWFYSYLLPWLGFFGFLGFCLAVFRWIKYLINGAG